jgi:4-amino-4-deoxy-L-arabinose transferase-like glycosyltransferase
MAIYLWLLWEQLALPFVYDDVNFAFAARAVAETGLPFANAGYMSDRFDFSQREQWALWHPPLYILLLGLQFKLFGISEQSARLLGTAFGLVSAVLVYVLGTTLARGELARRRVVGLLAAAVFLLSPLAIQSALILDIDGTVLTFLLTLMVLLLVRFPPERYPSTIWLLGGLFALSLWTKMTTPLGLLGCLVVARLLAGRFQQALRELLVIGLGGSALFLVTWGLASLLFRMPFDMPFAVTWIQLLDASSSRAWLRSPVTIAQTLAPSILWAGPYLALLFATAAVARLRRFLVVRRLEPIDLLIGFGALVFVVYLIKQAGGFPKYHVAMLPFWAVSAALLLGERVRRLAPVEAALLAVGGWLFWWYFTTRFPRLWVHGYYDELPSDLFVYPGLFALVLLAALYLAAGRGLGRGLALILAVLTLVWGPAVEHPMREAYYSTTYYHGTHGQREAAALVDSLTESDEFYAGSKEIAWYAANQRYIDQDTLEYFVRPTRQFDGTLVGHEVRVLALWIKNQFVRDLYLEALAPGYDLVAERGDYGIWLRRDR